MSTMHCSLLSLGCAFGFTAPHQQGSLSALRALKIAQRRLRPEVRAKLLSVSSARTDGGLTPDAWRFVFLDPATSGNCRVVTVAAKTSSEHPDTVEAFMNIRMDSVANMPVIPQNKLLIDSDRALEQAKEKSKLKGLHAADYRLLQQRGESEPFWLLQFYGEKEEPVGRFHVGAKTGVIHLLDGKR